MKKKALFVALCLICTSLSVANASTGLRNDAMSVAVNDSVSTGHRSQCIMLITGFSEGNQDATANVVTGILTEYENYRYITRVITTNPDSVVLGIYGPLDYVVGAQQFLLSNLPKYLNVTSTIVR